MPLVYISIQRYHNEIRKNKQKIITDNQIQQNHSEIKILLVDSIRKSYSIILISISELQIQLLLQMLIIS